MVRCRAPRLVPTPPAVVSVACPAHADHAAPDHVATTTGAAACGDVDVAAEGKSTRTAVACKAVARSSSPPTLSVRGAALAAKANPFWDVFDDMLGNPYDAISNPGGVINMGIANNFLMEPELLRFLPHALRHSIHPTDLTYGTSLFGSHRLFDALCHHYNRVHFGPPVLRVAPGHLITAPGCGSLLDQLFHHICDQGDGVLIAAPYYNGFDADLLTRSGATPVAVFSPFGDGTEPESFEGPSAMRNFEESKRAWEEAHPDRRVRAILVCNPHNPTGRCYDVEALLEYGRFAERHDLHLVFDEIYALSTFASSDGCSMPFHSCLSIDWAAVCHPGRIHMMSSSSKDFGLNGLRVGSLVSQHNPALIAALKSTAKLNMVSSAADALFSSLLRHDQFFEAFLEANRARLAGAYETVREWCEYHAIPHHPSSAGHFCLLDLRAYLPVDGRSDADRETALWTKLLECNVSLTPGSNYHHPTLGVFRLTFSLRPRALREGLMRLERALGLAPTWPRSAGGDEGAVEEEARLAPIAITDEDIERGLEKVSRHFGSLVGRPLASGYKRIAAREDGQEISGSAVEGCSTGKRPRLDPCHRGSLQTSLPAPSDLPLPPMRALSPGSAALVSALCGAPAARHGDEEGKGHCAQPGAAPDTGLSDDSQAQDLGSLARATQRLRGGGPTSCAC